MATILTKKSDTASAVPLAADLTNAAGGAELAVNATDKRLFSKTSGGTVVELGTNPTAMAVAGNTTVGGTLGVTGATTLAGVSATTLSASSTVTLSGGTANGVAYLNGSKVVTSGSALTFDGTNLSASGYVKAGTFSAITGALTAFVSSSGGIYSYYTGGSGYIASYSDNSATFSPLVFDGSYLAWRPAGSEGMRLTSTGLGIGTSSPDVFSLGGQNLTVRGAFTRARLNLNNSDSTSVGAVAGTITWGQGTTPYASIDGLSVGTVNSGALVFNTATSGTQAERMRLDSSGNLGLGVTPSAWSGVNGVFEIKGNAYIYSTTGVLSSGANAYFNGTNWIYKTTQAATRYEQVNGLHKWDIAASGTAGNAITFTQAMTLTAGGNLGIGATSMGTTRLVIRGDASTNFAVAKWSHSSNASSGFDIGYASSAASNDVSIWNYENGFIRFATNNSERCRIDSSGNLLVGTTSVTGAGASVGQIVTNFNGAVQNGMYVSDTRTSAGTDNAINFGRGSTLVGRLDTTLTSLALTNLSDQRVKTNVQDSENALGLVGSVKVRQFDWTIDNSHEDFGFVAQELNEVLPQAVSVGKTEEEMWGVNFVKLVPILTKAIQEQQAIINSLKARLDAANL